MHQCEGIGERINSYALVSYVPGRLGAYLDRMRRDLVSSCIAQSHITILPPRTIFAPASAVMRRLHAGLDAFSRFDLQLTDVQIFKSTSVVYLGVGQGRDSVLRMHDALNREELEFQEPFTFHPHITLAQDLSPDTVEEIASVAAARWAEFEGLRSFEINHLTFVQNTVQNCWVNLEMFTLPDLELAAI
jgi:2'-5' RNA ligase